MIKRGPFMTREDELKRDGWKKQGHYDEPRLSEVVQMYREIGFEVLAEPVCLEDLSGCKACMKENLDRFKMVYTRKVSGAEGASDRI